MSHNNISFPQWTLPVDYTLTNQEPPLPAGWHEATDLNGRKYYYHADGRSTWDRPLPPASGPSSPQPATASSFPFSSYRPAYANPQLMRQAQAPRSGNLQLSSITGSPSVGTFTKVRTVSNMDEADIYEVHNDQIGRCAAKIGDEESIAHQINLYRHVGAHPNLNHIHGWGHVNMDDNIHVGMIMDMNDFNGETALGAIRAARQEERLSDGNLFDILLPYIARALIAVCTHMARVQVAHMDIDEANILFSKDGSRLELIDLELAAIQKHSPQQGWSSAEITSGNPMVNIYPRDRECIKTVLRKFAGFIDEYGEDVEPEDLTGSMRAFNQFLSRFHPATSDTLSAANNPHDFDFLYRGNDHNAQQILREIFEDIQQEE